jgi:hypothetical protein
MQTRGVCEAKKCMDFKKTFMMSFSMICYDFSCICALVATEWHIIRMQMEETASRYEE